MARWWRADAPRGGHELSRMLGANPNLALSVLEGLGRWEAGRMCGGHGPAAQGLGQVAGPGGG